MEIKKFESIEFYMENCESIFFDYKDLIYHEIKYKVINQKVKFEYFKCVIKSNAKKNCDAIILGNILYKQNNFKRIMLGKDIIFLFIYSKFNCVSGNFLNNKNKLYYIDKKGNLVIEIGNKNL